MLQRIIGLLLFAAVVTGVILLVRNNPLATKTATNTAASTTPAATQPGVTINGHTFTVEVARTEAEKEKGLADRDALAVDQGMLFPFDTPGDYGFWMKGMRFPLDIIYFRDNKVVTIIADAKPPKNTKIDPPIFHPTALADIVLEINAGLAQKYNIKLGDQATITQ